MTEEQFMRDFNEKMEKIKKKFMEIQEIMGEDNPITLITFARASIVLGLVDVYAVTSFTSTMPVTRETAGLFLEALRDNAQDIPGNSYDKMRKERQEKEEKELKERVNKGPFSSN